LQLKEFQNATLGINNINN